MRNGKVMREISMEGAIACVLIRWVGRKENRYFVGDNAHTEQA